MGELVDWHIRLSNPGGYLVSLAVAAMAMVAVALAVRELAGVRPTRRRAVLLGLRVVTALSLIALAVQPQWIGERLLRIGGTLAVVMDMSRSMTIRDGSATRAEHMRVAVNHWLSGARTHPTLHGFGAEVGAIDRDVLDAELRTVADETNIAPALRELVKGRGAELGAVVLVSDGASSEPGFAPERLADLGVRVHTVVVGQAPEGDDSISGLEVDSVSFAHQEAVIRVTVTSSRTDPEPTVVTLRRGDRVIREASVEFQNGQGAAELSVIPERPGRIVYSVSIPVADGDWVPENNERTFLLDVVPDRRRILLVAGAPSWDSRFLRGFLKADPSIDLITFFILRTPSDNSMAPPNELSLIPFPTSELFQEHLDSFDVVIFQNFDFGPYEMAGYLPRIRDYVQRGGSFVMVGGALSFGAGGYDRTAIADLVPLAMAHGKRALVEGEFKPRLGADAALHPVLELHPDPQRNQLAWQGLATVDGANRFLGLKPGAQALLVHPTERTSTGEPMPVLATAEVGEGRVLSLGIDSSWRWSITTAGQRGDASAYERFWDRVLRWIGRDPALEPSRLTTDRTQYGSGAPIHARMRLRDSAFRSLSTTEVTARIEDAEGGTVDEVRVDTDAEGRAELQLRAPVEPGGYALAVQRADAADPLVREPFVVEIGGEELSDPAPRPELLERIAGATGGRHFARLEDLKSLDDLERTRARSLGTVIERPFASGFYFAAVVFLFGVEWTLRRRWGLR